MKPALVTTELPRTEPCWSPTLIEFDVNMKYISNTLIMGAVRFPVNTYRAPLTSCWRDDSVVKGLHREELNSFPT